MKIVLFVALGLVGLWVALRLVGALLPPQHVAICRLRVGRPRAEVFQLLREFEAYPSWRKELRRVEVIPPSPSGALRWREMTGDEALTLELVEARQDEALVVRIADPKLPYGGTWSYRLEPDGPGTLLTVQEDGVVRDPIYRVLARFVFGHTGTMRSVLASLATRLKSAERPTVVRAR